MGNTDSMLPLMAMTDIVSDFDDVFDSDEAGSKNQEPPSTNSENSSENHDMSTDSEKWSEKYETLSTDTEKWCEKVKTECDTDVDEEEKETESTEEKPIVQDLPVTMPRNWIQVERLKMRLKEIKKQQEFSGAALPSSSKSNFGSYGNDMATENASDALKIDKAVVKMEENQTTSVFSMVKIEQDLDARSSSDESDKLYIDEDADMSCSKKSGFLFSGNSHHCENPAKKIKVDNEQVEQLNLTVSDYRTKKAKQKSNKKKKLVTTKKARKSANSKSSDSPELCALSATKINNSVKSVLKQYGKSIKEEDDEHVSNAGFTEKDSDKIQSGNDERADSEITRQSSENVTKQQGEDRASSKTSDPICRNKSSMWIERLQRELEIQRQQRELMSKVWQQKEAEWTLKRKVLEASQRLCETELKALEMRREYQTRKELILSKFYSSEEHESDTGSDISVGTEMDYSKVARVNKTATDVATVEASVAISSTNASTSSTAAVVPKQTHVVKESNSKSNMPVIQNKELNKSQHRELSTPKSEVAEHVASIHIKDNTASIVYPVDGEATPIVSPGVSAQTSKPVVSTNISTSSVQASATVFNAQPVQSQQNPGTLTFTVPNSGCVTIPIVDSSGQSKQFLLWTSAPMASGQNQIASTQNQSKSVLAQPVSRPTLLARNPFTGIWSPVVTVTRQQLQQSQVTQGQNNQYLLAGTGLTADLKQRLRNKMTPATTTGCTTLTSPSAPRINIPSATSNSHALNKSPVSTKVTRKSPPTQIVLTSTGKIVGFHTPKGLTAYQTCKKTSTSNAGIPGVPIFAKVRPSSPRSLFCIPHSSFIGSSSARSPVPAKQQEKENQVKHDNKISPSSLENSENQKQPKLKPAEDNIHSNTWMVEKISKDKNSDKDNQSVCVGIPIKSSSSLCTSDFTVKSSGNTKTTDSTASGTPANMQSSVYTLQKSVSETGVKVKQKEQPKGICSYTSLMTTKTDNQDYCLVSSMDTYMTVPKKKKKTKLSTAGDCSVEASLVNLNDTARQNESTVNSRGGKVDETKSNCGMVKDSQIKNQRSANPVPFVDFPARIVVSGNEKGTGQKTVKIVPTPTKNKSRKCEERAVRSKSADYLASSALRELIKTVEKRSENGLSEGKGSVSNGVKEGKTSTQKKVNPRIKSKQQAPSSHLKSPVSEFNCENTTEQSFKGQKPETLHVTIEKILDDCDKEPNEESSTDTIDVMDTKKPLMKRKSQLIQSFYSDSNIDSDNNPFKDTENGKTLPSTITSSSGSNVQNDQGKKRKVSRRKLLRSPKEKLQESEPVPRENTSKEAESTDTKKVSETVLQAESEPSGGDKSSDTLNTDIVNSSMQLSMKKFVKTKFIILKGDICDRWLDIKKKTGFGEMSDPKFVHYLLRLEEIRQDRMKALRCRQTQCTNTQPAYMDENNNCEISLTTGNSFTIQPSNRLSETSPVLKFLLSGNSNATASSNKGSSRSADWMSCTASSSTQHNDTPPFNRTNTCSAGNRHTLTSPERRAKSSVCGNESVIHSTAKRGSNNTNILPDKTEPVFSGQTGMETSPEKTESPFLDRRNMSSSPNSTDSPYSSGKSMITSPGRTHSVCSSGLCRISSSEKTNSVCSDERGMISSPYRTGSSCSGRSINTTPDRTYSTFQGSRSPSPYKTESTASECMSRITSPGTSQSCFSDVRSKSSSPTYDLLNNQNRTSSFSSNRSVLTSPDGSESACSRNNSPSFSSQPVFTTHKSSRKRKSKRIYYLSPKTCSDRSENSAFRVTAKTKVNVVSPEGKKTLSPSIEKSDSSIDRGDGPVFEKSPLIKKTSVEMKDIETVSTPGHGNNLSLKQNDCEVNHFKTEDCESHGNLDNRSCETSKNAKNISGTTITEAKDVQKSIQRKIKSETAEKSDDVGNYKSHVVLPNSPAISTPGSSRKRLVNKVPLVSPVPAKKARVLSNTTEKRMQWAVRTFQDWLMKTGERDFCFENKTARWLDKHLAKFYVCSKLGSDQLKEFRRMLSFYLTTHTCSQSVSVSIALDGEYEHSNTTLNGIMVGKKSTEPKEEPILVPISDEDLEALYSTRTLSDDNPTNLVQKVWFDITYHLCKGNLPRTFWHGLLKHDVILESDVNGVYYVFRRNFAVLAGEEQGKMYATPDDPEKCPVRSTSLYLSKILSSKCKALFQLPNKHWKPGGDKPWYRPVALGQERLYDMMGNICLQAKLSRIYTYDSVIYTAELKSSQTL